MAKTAQEKLDEKREKEYKKKHKISNMESDLINE